MENFHEMKSTDLITLWCDLCRPNNIWSNQGVSEWKPTQNFIDLLSRIEQTLVEKLILLSGKLE